MSSLYILEISPLSDIWFAIIFSHSMLSFQFFDFPLLCRISLFNVVSYFYFAFLTFQVLDPIDYKNSQNKLWFSSQYYGILFPWMSSPGLWCFVWGFLSLLSIHPWQPFFPWTVLQVCLAPDWISRFLSSWRLPIPYNQQ